jgi:hypothetical protein
MLGREMTVFATVALVVIMGAACVTPMVTPAAVFVTSIAPPVPSPLAAAIIGTAAGSIACVFAKNTMHKNDRDILMVFMMSPQVKR